MLKAVQGFPGWDPPSTWERAGVRVPCQDGSHHPAWPGTPRQTHQHMDLPWDGYARAGPTPWAFLGSSSMEGGF